MTRGKCWKFTYLNPKGDGNCPANDIEGIIRQTLDQEKCVSMDIDQFGST
jgi:hypothetical protein